MKSTHTGTMTINTEIQTNMKKIFENFRKFINEDIDSEPTSITHE